MIIHFGAPIALAVLFRLNLLVTLFCGILPDIIDKPLAMLGIAGGRYTGHSLLFALLVSIGFFLWKKKYGLSAAVGLISHLLLDLPGVPWFYPFKDYDFFSYQFDLLTILRNYFTTNAFGYEILAVTIMFILAFGGRWLYDKYIKHKKS